MPVVMDTAQRPELVIGLVGPAGTRLDDLSSALRNAFVGFGYATTEIRLSGLLSQYSGWRDRQDKREGSRIRHLQQMGNEFRRSLADSAALARAAIAAIREARGTALGDPDRPQAANAYILRQLKHPAEVDLLRRVYGSAFLLVGAHAPLNKRLDTIAAIMAQTELKSGQEHLFRNSASEIIAIDEKEDDTYGQNTRDTYPQSDFFVDMGLPSPSGESEVGRFVDLVFAHPYRTPTPDEYAMYQAHAVSLRSSDDRRQVGAVIVSLTRDRRDRVKNADVIAVGMNEVPRGGGGFYWDRDSPDCRDQELLRQGFDRAREIKTSALAELLERIRGKGWFKAELSESTEELALNLLPEIQGTQFMDIGEFGRTVHAEMAALVDSARRGVAVTGHTMYVTTFPCHNCAKHIIASGIRLVVYLEPYAKSRANFLHNEEIVLFQPGRAEEEGRVVFSAFSGIAPRKYAELFSMSERGAKKGLTVRQWEESKRSLSPRYVGPNAALAYLAGERQELEPLRPEVYRWDRATICPDNT